MIPQILCGFCRVPFEKTHGNQLYCSSVCKNYQKSAKQYRVYGILREFRKCFLSNHKLFEKILEKEKRKELPLSHPDLKCFTPNAFYGQFINDRKEILYRVGEFCFQIIIKKSVSFLLIIKSI